MVREVREYHRQLKELHPQFDDCPLPCAVEDKDLPDLCAVCDVRKQWDFFRESFDEQMERRFKGEPPADWSFAGLFRDVIRVMNLDGGFPAGGYPDGCDALTARCLDIVRAERVRDDRIAAWNNRPQDGAK